MALYAGRIVESTRMACRIGNAISQYDTKKNVILHAGFNDGQGNNFFSKSLAIDRTISYNVLYVTERTCDR
jgi:hypothetical protein